MFSDTLLAALVTDKAVITHISIFKGWIFVVVTAGLLYWLIRRYAGKQRSAVVKIERLNNLYRAIVKISEAILRIKDRNQLFSEACRLAVEESGLRMAWIGLVEEKDNVVRPAASCGVVDGYLDQIRISIDPDIPEGQGPTGIAIREGRNFICNDIENDPRMLPWREQALKRGYRSSVAFPLKSESRIVGSLNLYASEPSFFDDEEIMLIETLAADLSLAIESIRHEDERLKAEEALRESEARMRSVFEQANDGIYIISAENRYLNVNERGLELLGYTRDELLQMSVAEVLTPHEVARLAVEPPRMMAGVPHLAEWDHVRKDGSTFPGEVSARRLNDHSYLAIIRDLTEHKRAEEKIRTLNKELEQRVKDRTAELEAKIAEIERMNKLFVGRELRMVELKERIKELEP